MVDNLAIIERVLAEHSLVRQSVKLVGDSVNDVEALFDLNRTYSGLSQSSLEELPRRQERLQQTLSLFQQGLANHFAFEEDALPPLFGEVLMNALVLEHSRIRQVIDQARALVFEQKADKLSQEERLAWKTHLQEIVNNIAQEVRSHAAGEEVVLRMLRKYLQESA